MCVCVCVCVCVAKPVAVELRCHATALIKILDFLMFFMQFNFDVRTFSKFDSED